MLTVCHNYPSKKDPNLPSNLPDPKMFNIQQIETLPVTSVQLKTATNRDPILIKVPYRTKLWRLW